jgi:hypothetical protein
LLHCWDPILTDADGDEEQLGALHQAFEEYVPMPADAFVIGEPIEVFEIAYDGNARRGLTARCRRPEATSTSSPPVTSPSRTAPRAPGTCE